MAPCPLGGGCAGAFEGDEGITIKSSLIRELLRLHLSVFFVMSMKHMRIFDQSCHLIGKASRVSQNLPHKRVHYNILIFFFQRSNVIVLAGKRADYAMF